MRSEDATEDFEERLLRELQRLVVERQDLAPQAHDQRSVGRHARRSGFAMFVAAGLTAAIAALLSSASTPAFAISNRDGAVTAVINSFQDPTGLERGLAAAGVPAMIQLLARGTDCDRPPSWTPVPSSALPSFNPADKPSANPPIDVSVGSHGQLTLILRSIPPNATLVIESVPTAGIRPPLISKSAVGISTVTERGIYVVWAQGRAAPCTVVSSAVATAAAARP